jgi:prepilin-type processing-associated H-X9-DG protein
MYIQDYDERMVPPEWRSTSTPPAAFPNDRRNWPELIQTYLKNWGIARCPSVADDPFGIWNGSNQNIKWYYNWMRWTAYGMNWNYLFRGPNPADPCDGIDPTYLWHPRWTPVSLADIGKPAETVMLTDSKYVGSSAGWFTTWYVDSPAAIWAPDTCTYSNGGWGAGSWGDTINWASRPTSTGQFDTRHSGGGNVTFCDGHVKWMTPGNLAIGTNWRRGINSGDIQITDRNLYLWDLQ